MIPLKKFCVDNSLPIRSRCYEEIVLKELINGPKTQDELIEFVPRKSFSRIMKRLQKRGLVAKNKRLNHIIYFKARSTTRRRLTPTEK